MLKVGKIEVGYGALQVLWGVDLEVKKGEILAVLGSNGSGKTTLCRTIVGLLKPKKGKITFEGERIDGFPTPEVIKKGIILVPEGGHLFGNLTVRENLELGAYPSPRSRGSVDELLEWVYGIFPILKERENQLAATLSGGERQMLAIARGLMAKPSLLILDEPSLGLAPKIVAKVFKTVEEINEEGVTIVVVEQNAVKALEISDRAYIIETGRIVLEGRSDELLREESVKKAYLAI